MIATTLGIGALCLIQKDLKILFLGNSHTTGFNIPSMVQSLLLSDNIPGKVEFNLIVGSNLDQIYQSPQTLHMIRNGKWTHVILQGQKISMSHKYNYSTQEGILLAKEAKKAGAEALFFAEWPRKGIDESDYIYGIYDSMAKASGAKVLPICYVWDAAMKLDSKTVMWAGDGNHSAHPGAFLAATVIYNEIVGPKGNPNWLPSPVNSSQAAMYLKLARKFANSEEK